jgi:hypothetical protein
LKIGLQCLALSNPFCRFALLTLEEALVPPMSLVRLVCVAVARALNSARRFVQTGAAPPYRYFSNPLHFFYIDLSLLGIFYWCRDKRRFALSFF